MNFAQEILKQIQLIADTQKNLINSVAEISNHIEKLDPNFQFENELSAPVKPSENNDGTIPKGTETNLQRWESFIIEKPELFAEAVYLKNKGVSIETVQNMTKIGNGKQCISTMFWAAKRLGYVTQPKRGSYKVTDLFRELMPEDTSKKRVIN